MVQVNRRLALCLVFLFAVPYLSARVARVEITSRADVLDANPFGESGPYERISGRVYFAVPVANIHNQGIVDLPNAVNLQNGEVEFSADFVAVRPKDATKGNGTLLLENPNRWWRPQSALLCITHSTSALVPYPIGLRVQRY